MKDGGVTYFNNSIIPSLIEHHRDALAVVHREETRMKTKLIPLASSCSRSSSLAVAVAAARRRRRRRPFITAFINFVE